MAASTTPPLLALHGIRKQFGPVKALDGVDLTLQAGEIHALLGENGAGKSTLIKILAGLYQADAGTMLIAGHETALGSVAVANALGIRVIHQELTLAPNLTVAENIFLGREPTRFGFVRTRQRRNLAVRLLRDLRLNDILPIDALVGSLSTAQQQLVEIARALSTPSRILILDEPTASLSHEECERLFVRLRDLRAQGVGIIYISHRLEEIRRLADRVTVLRDGRSVGTQDAGSYDQATLVRWMVGRELAEHYPKPTSTIGPVALQVTNLYAKNVHGVSFELRQGEILGFAGLVGAGRTDLARALFGLNAIAEGTVSLEGKAITLRSPSEARTHGIVLVPEDRKRQGLVLHRSVGFNAALPWTNRWLRGIIPKTKLREQIIQRVIHDFAVRGATADTTIGQLSGGNQQKVIVGRWMEVPPKVLILDEPTRGVDVGAREEMFRIIHRLAEQGLAVVLISSDLPEVLALSHRVAIYRDGRIIRFMSAADASPEAVMHLLTGSKHS